MIKSEKDTKIFTNKKDKYVQYAITVALNCENLSINTLKKITKTKPFTSNYNWEEINYPSEKDDCEKFEKKSNQYALCFVY